MCFKSYLLPLSFLVVLLFSSTVYCQTVNITHAQVAIKSGSSKELSKFFSTTVQLNIEGDKINYSRNEGENVIRNFFKKYPPVDFKIIHQGQSKEGLNYAIGKYTYGEGTYRIYMLIRGEEIETMDLTKE